MKTAKRIERKTVADLLEGTGFNPDNLEAVIDLHKDPREESQPEDLAARQRAWEEARETRAGGH